VEAAAAAVEQAQAQALVEAEEGREIAFFEVQLQVMRETPVPFRDSRRLKDPSAR
jgi:hypothetical protein